MFTVNEKDVKICTFRLPVELDCLIEKTATANMTNKTQLLIQILREYFGIENKKAVLQETA